MSVGFFQVRLSLTAVVAFALSCMITAVSMASLLQPPAEQFSDEQFLVEIAAPSDSTAGAGHSELPAEEPTDSPDREFAELIVAKFAASKANMPSGTSSSSSSIGSGSSSLVLGCLSEMLPVVQDDRLLNRFVLDLQLYLPDAPANELFHPPRIWS